MKFGKYLATRQLELPEYSGHFINYKQLKKLINALSQDTSTPLQDKKGSFFFRLERELEKVNEFYLERESELKFRLDILIEKKQKLIRKGNLSKNNITFVSLYDGFKKFSKDLDRLEQFIELNETGFTKVLKKWDKRSKSSTKELYLTTTVNVQPIFHRNEIVDLSDFVANNLMELEAIGDGDSTFIRYESKNDDQKSTSHPVNEFKESDQLYTDFYDITVQNANLQENDQVSKLKEWSNQVISMLSPDTKKFTLSKVFMLLISNPLIPDASLLKFYNLFQDLIDLEFIDDLNKRNCLIEVSNCQADRNEIFKICLKSNLNPSAWDVTGRTCLHYLTENDRNDLLILILEYIKTSDYNLQEIIDQMDYESISPLLLAIINNNIDCVKTLLLFGSNAFPSQDDNKPKYLPFNVACKIGNIKIVELLLNQIGSPDQAKSNEVLTSPSQCNAEGLLPLHIVASSGNSHLVPLLLQYGADINQVDKLNKWSSIFYSVYTGNVNMTEILIEFGADFNLKDEENFDPLFYSIWEGNIGVLNVLIRSIKSQQDQLKTNPSPNEKNYTDKKNHKPMLSLPLSASNSLDFDLENDNIDMIPELSLPPPIIPLRKYGHNFLEKRISLKLSFYTNRHSIHLNPNTFLTSIPGRITLTCANTDLIPRNIILPVLDNSKSITFQIESIDDNFNIDLELFPTFGTRLLAKATLNSSILKTSWPGIGTKVNGDIELPLLDVRLKSIGLIKFNYEVIHPYSGIPLEISMYDTYWKSSPTSDEKAKEVKSISFVTSSSLTGEYYRSHISMLHDGTPLVCPSYKINIGDNVEMPVCLFNYDQLKSIIYKNETNYNLMVSALKSINETNVKEALPEILKSTYLPLNDFLQLIDSNINLNLEIFYPSICEFENYDLNAFTCVDLNSFTDLILSDIFNHVRTLRIIKNNHHSRSLLLSSNNSNVCTILNWKQPNYPVFYNLNGNHFSKNEDKFFECSANGFQKSLSNDQAIVENQLTNFKKIDNIDSINKDSTEFISSLEYSDKLTRSIKLAITYATFNNLLGVTIPKKLLSLSPELIKMIRSKGLILVASNDDDPSLESYVNDLAMDKDLGVHGFRINEILCFKDSIDM